MYAHKRRLSQVERLLLLPEVVDASAIQVSWKAIDYASGLDTYDVQRRRVGSTAWTTSLSGTAATSAWFVGQAGASYEFRVSAVDMKGNRQPWVNVPAQPAALSAATFARVSATSLNVRSGPGTGYAVLATLSQGARVELIDGPTSADGYSWWRVQFGFAEWPSSDYPRIGYVAAGSGPDAYIVPAKAPTITKLDPFVADLSHPAAFSPNGDGAHDTLTVGYRLKGASTATRLDVLNQAGAVVRSLSLGAQPSGSNSATWDGRLAGGGWATAGRYLLRVVATDAGGAAHAAPSSAFDAGLLAAAGVTADLTPPSVKSAAPGSGAAMEPLSATLSVNLSEPVSGVNGSSVRLTSTLKRSSPRTTNARSPGRR